MFLPTYAKAKIKAHQTKLSSMSVFLLQKPQDLCVPSSHDPQMPLSGICCYQSFAHGMLCLAKLLCQGLKPLAHVASKAGA